MGWMEEDSAGNLWFRAAAGNSIENRESSTFVVDGKFRIRLSGDFAEPVIRQEGGRTELLVPIRFRSNAASLIEEMTW